VIWWPHQQDGKNQGGKGGKEVDDATNDDEHAHGNILNLWYINVTRGTDRESRNKINV
jgi:hypothetical protein